jgi:hypothetical protein
MHVHSSEISHWLLLEQKSPMNNYLKQYDPLCALRVSVTFLAQRGNKLPKAFCDPNFSAKQVPPSLS